VTTSPRSLHIAVVLLNYKSSRSNTNVVLLYPTNKRTTKDHLQQGQRPSSPIDTKTTTHTPPPKMCIVMRTTYSSCGHRAPNTADETYYCEAAINRGFVKCLPGEGLDVRTTHLDRGYCDMCCITAITVAKAKGMDMQDYARSLGVNLNDLMRDNPQWRP